MGYWRGVGYFISILFIIGGFLIAIPTYGAGLILSILGFIFIWMLKRGASQQRMEKHIREMNERDKDRAMRENAESGKRSVNEASQRYLAELESRKKENENKKNSGGIQDASNLAQATSYAAVEVQDTVYDIENSDEEYEDENNN